MYQRAGFYFQDRRSARLRLLKIRTFVWYFRNKTQRKRCFCMQNNNESDEISDFEFLSIEESIKRKKEQRNNRNKEYQDKLDKLQARTNELKQQIKDDQNKKRT